MLAATVLVMATGTSSYADDTPLGWLLPVKTPAVAPVVGPVVTPVVAPVVAPVVTPVPAPVTAVLPKAGYSPTGTWMLLAKVNAHRRALGLTPLVVNAKLAAAARSWTERMVARNGISHNEALFSRTSHTNLRMAVLGENVGWNYSVAAQDAAFLHSHGHRTNIEMARFRSAGFAVIRGADGRIWSTEDFGTPSR